MDTLHVNADTKTYPVYIGEDLRYDVNRFLSKTYTAILIITDDCVGSHYLQDVKQALAHDRVFTHTIPAGEEAKSIDIFYQLQTKAITCGLDRQSLILALGGGVVGDAAGFVAATFMRGIDFVQMPTTILAHDSSVGGKVAINHEQGKNLIGSFYPPDAVIYDINTLHTLSNKEVRSGYAEIIKEALLGDADFFHELINQRLASLTNRQLTDHIRKGINIKASIVEQDERESNIRKFLNLGHTLGHALESLLGYGKWTHGELVAVGLLFAIRVSEKSFSTNLPFDELYTWLKNNGYPLALPVIDPGDVLSKMKLDKKAFNSEVQMVLLQAVGRPSMAEVDDCALLDYLESFFEELTHRN
ncbi:3-dehydroquinate synthase [Lentibacillus cibarius]|uniref:3-dehydroquinate synthase n=1 Tax=Lentibacillus cibarius TaxID=2583219 RepID=A0A549YL18_9BACI|nr:3-dehydroquinate synthase [Lentibacillus cibarius]TRM12571.1 3-dehydroquinate synthase [Lentibacillus cibarius]